MTKLEYDTDSAGGTRIGYLLVICMVAALGGLLFGFDTAVISGAIGFVTDEFHLTPQLTGWVASSALLGCMLGAMIAGLMSDGLGRKKTMLLSAIAFTLSAVLCKRAAGVNALVVGRVIGGVGIGIASMLSPLYIAEIAPPRMRGRLVSLQQFAIISGLLGAYFSNLFILKLHMTDAVKWRWMFGFGVFPAALFLVLLFLVPESPRWLVKQGLVERARRILTRVIGGTDADGEINEIQSTLATETASFSSLFEKPMRTALFIGIILAIFQQITGINAVLYYAPEIFKTAGSGAASAFTDTVWIGIVNMVFTVAAIALIDKVGRKALLIGGTIGMTISLAALGFAFRAGLSGKPLLFFVMAYVACFAISQGPVVWVIISEIFPNRTRGRAMSVATVMLWGACFLVSDTFPILQAKAGPAATFWIYGAMCVISLVLTKLFVPETKSKSLEEIERFWLGERPEGFPVIQPSRH